MTFWTLHNNVNRMAIKSIVMHHGVLMPMSGVLMWIWSKTCVHFHLWSKSLIIHSKRAVRMSSSFMDCVFHSEQASNCLLINKYVPWHPLTKPNHPNNFDSRDKLLFNICICICIFYFRSAAQHLHFIFCAVVFVNVRLSVHEFKLISFIIWKWLCDWFSYKLVQWIVIAN